jgi:hypothetical protein
VPSESTAIAKDNVIAKEPKCEGRQGNITEIDIGEYAAKNNMAKDNVIAKESVLLPRSYCYPEAMCVPTESTVIAKANLIETGSKM